MRNLDLKRAAALMEQPKLLGDGRNVYDPRVVQDAGLLYRSFGRGQDLLMLKRRGLVTGGARFIGSHLCERLLSEGYRVICIDNLRTGSFENVARLICLDHGAER